MRLLIFIGSMIATGLCFAGTAHHLLGIGHASFLPLGGVVMCTILTIAVIRNLNLKQVAQEANADTAHIAAATFRQSEVDIWLMMSLIGSVLGGSFIALTVAKGENSLALVMVGILIPIVGNFLYQAHCLERQEHRVNS
jgi:hypothetical protein